MKNRIVTAVFKDSAYTKSDNAWQWDYGQILRIQGLKLPTAVEVHFAVSGVSESITRIGTTKDGVTDVVIPDSLIETGKNLVAYVYLRDSESGNTEYQIDIVVSKRAKPEAYNTPDDPELFGKAIEAVNKAADRAEKAGQDAVEAAGQAAEDAQQTAEDREEVAKMVETVSDISEQVKKVEELSNKAQEAATKTGQDAQQTTEDRVEVGKMLETVKDVSEQVKSVEESVQKAKESEQAAAGHRTAVEEMKNSVEQTASTFPQKVQEGVQAIENAGASEVQEITQAGTAQKTAVEGAGTQAVENVENVKASATEAVETAKTTAVQAVQAEGTKQTGNVTAEGTKQVKAVQDKGNEVLQSIPEDFTTQMETKLNKQQGVENKGKVLVIGEDGNVVPGEVSSGGGDGIAIINTMSGESPLVIPDSAERVNKGLELGGKTEQVQTTGKNLIDYRNAVAGLLNFTDGSFSGTYHKYFTTDFIEIEIGDYIISHNSNAGIQSYALYDINDKTYISGKAATNKVNTLNKCFIRISFSTKPETDVSSDPVSYARKCNIQIEKGTSATPYEPYTGGKPSPSPEYPQEIVNAGKWNEETQKYEVDVKITGKNLFDKCLLEGGEIVEFNGVECYKYKDDSNNFKYKGKFKNGQQYALTTRILRPESKKSYGTYIKFKYEDGTDSVLYAEHGGLKTLVSNIGKTIDSIISNYNYSTDCYLDLSVTRLSRGGQDSGYQPYKEQTLTVTSDRPITKWDRLVEQGGQIGWLYQSAINEYRGDTVIAIYGTGFYFLLNNKKLKSGEGYCEELKQHVPSDEKPCISFNMSQNTYAYTLNTQAIYGSTVSAIKEYLKTHPLHLVYKTETTEFVPLPQSEQDAVRNLRTYYPTTVITADGGELYPDIKVTYTADTKNYIDGKVSAKVASILRQYQADTVNLLSLMPMETQAAMIENDTNRILENVEEMKYE